MARRAPGSMSREQSPVDRVPAGPDGEPTGSSDTEKSKSQSPERTAQQVDPETRQRLIRELAYRRYAERGFVEGSELEDWLKAESDVDRQLAKSSPT